MFEKGFLEEVEEASKKYEEELNQILGKSPGVQREYVTTSGIPLKTLYTPNDIKEKDFLREISFPGQYPFTRGNFPAGYRSRPWHIRQVTGLGTAEETNQRWKFLLSQGATALAVVGLKGWGPDADDERTIGMAGKDEIVADTLADYETLFDGIDLQKISIHLITGAPFALACYIAVAEKQGIQPKELRGSMSNALRPHKECLDILEYCTRNMPFFNAGYIDVRNVREAGCTAPQEIAFGIAMGMATAEALIVRGIDIDEFAHRITWFVNSGPEFFEEVAKFRALRRLWAKTMRECYGAKDPRSGQMRCHVQTYAPTLTAQQPFNNLIRSTIYALAAIMGGAQSLHVNSFDEVLAIPTEFSASLSVKTQQIILHETGIASVVDPLGGSYYVEWLTDRLEEEAQKIIETIQAKGGAFKAWDWMSNEVREAACRWQKDFDDGKRILVGVNAFVAPNDLQTKALQILQEHADFEVLYEYESSIRDKQIARLEKVRRERDNEKVEKAKKRLQEAFQSGENIVPPLIEAVKAYLSQGEVAQICGAKGFGEFRYMLG